MVWMVPSGLYFSSVNLTLRLLSIPPDKTVMLEQIPFPLKLDNGMMSCQPITGSSIRPCKQRAFQFADRDNGGWYRWNRRDSNNHCIYATMDPQNISCPHLPRLWVSRSRQRSESPGATLKTEHIIGQFCDHD